MLVCLLQMPQKHRKSFRKRSLTSRRLHKRSWKKKKLQKRKLIVIGLRKKKLNLKPNF